MMFSMLYQHPQIYHQYFSSDVPRFWQLRNGELNFISVNLKTACLCCNERKKNNCHDSYQFCPVYMISIMPCHTIEGTQLKCIQIERHCTGLHCTELYHAALHFNALCFTSLEYLALHYNTLNCSSLAIVTFLQRLVFSSCLLYEWPKATTKSADKQLFQLKHKNNATDFIWIP